MVRSDGSSKDLSTAYGIFSTSDASITPIDIQDSIISSKITSPTDIENYYNTGNIEGWTKIPKGDGRFNNFSSLRSSYDAESLPVSIRDYNNTKGSVKTIIKVDGEWYDMNGNKL